MRFGSTSCGESASHPPSSPLARTWKETLETEASENEGVASRATDTVIANPEEFGHRLAHLVLGANAGFTESTVFASGGMDDHLNGLAKKLGYTGLAEVVEENGGVRLRLAKHR